MPPQWRADFLAHVENLPEITFNSPQYDRWLGHLVHLLDFITQHNVCLDEDLWWVDCGPYYLYLAPQRSEPWKEVRKGRGTGSRMAEICGLSMYHKCPDFDPIVPSDISWNLKKKPYARSRSIETTAKNIAGLEEEQFSKKTLEIMAHGTRVEPIIQKTHGLYIKQTILEMPLAVPKWCPYLGVSVDGYIVSQENTTEAIPNGIAEYKAPQRMYDSLEMMLGLSEYKETVVEGITIRESQLPANYNLIPINHLIQQILGMEVFDKDFSDYVVYDAVKENYMSYVRIPRQKELWQRVIWPTFQKFIEEHLKPLLGDKYPLLPPNWKNEP